MPSERKKRAGRRKRSRSALALAATDLLILAAALLVFAYFHHVMPTRTASVGVVIARGGAQPSATDAPDADIPQAFLTSAPDAQIPQPLETNAPDAQISLPLETNAPDAQISLPSATNAPDAAIAAAPGAGENPAGAALSPDANPTIEVTPVPTAQPQQAAQDQPADPVGWFGAKFADKFTDGEILYSDATYQSANLNLTLTKRRVCQSQCYVLDIYVKDITNLQTGFAKDSYGKGYAEWPLEIAERMGAVAAINGDYYGLHSKGVVIRNGVLYRDKLDNSQDVCVLYYDGSMTTYDAGKFDLDEAVARGAYQAWSFGPRLLDDIGVSMSKFNSSVEKTNPRAAIGCFEPGHYCFVVVDGRSERSSGMTLRELSQLMETLGCTSAYNLDGGTTAQMVCAGKRVSKPCENGRRCSDIIAVVDVAAQQP